MKKGLLYSALLFLGVSAGQVNAQEFDYYTEGKTNTAVATELDQAGAGVTQNGINLKAGVAIETTGTGSNLEAVADGDYVRIGFRGNAAYLVLTSANPLNKIAFYLRGSNNTSAGSLTITYGADATATTTTNIGPITGGAPGGLGEFVFPTADVKYVKIQRLASAGTTRLYRVAASTSAFTIPNPLPLDFLSFDAKANQLGNAVNLNWSTTNEVNTQGFVIERSANGADFTAVGNVASKNVAGVHNYSFVDEAPVAGNAYYRIKQVDNDGAFTYSAVVTAKASAAVSIYPNPAQDKITVEGASSVKVLSLDGKVVATSASSTVDVSALSAGVYVVVYENAGEQVSAKFVKN